MKPYKYGEKHAIENNHVKMIRPQRTLEVMSDSFIGKTTAQNLSTAMQMMDKIDTTIVRSDMKKTNLHKMLPGIPSIPRHVTNMVESRRFVTITLGKMTMGTTRSDTAMFIMKKFIVFFMFAFFCRTTSIIKMFPSKAITRIILHAKTLKIRMAVESDWITLYVSFIAVRSVVKLEAMPQHREYYNLWI